MEEDAEKRLQSFKDKLFHTPRHSSSLTSMQTRGIKRPYSMLSKSKGSDSQRDRDLLGQSLPCRPWDREDLLRRLATFKSMSWFAKPKAIDAINCARRGWINVDMDVIACEACGARLLFTTPASWNQQQIAKAASVFSLKLDNGHKPHCPWLDNCCDEKLALFPPTPTEILVEHYIERSSALLKLLALPLMSASAIQSMKNPLLEQFLRQSISVECSKGSDDTSLTEFLRSDSEAVSTDSYYQAHKLLSLCGWEPRLLPYIVDSNEGAKQSTNPNLSAVSQAVTVELKNNMKVLSKEKSGADRDSLASDDRYDPNSVVLDCKLCGASAGLWTFALVSRPLELVRVVGCTEVDSRRSLGNDNRGNGNIAGGGSMAKLSKTIAGGPPPAQQNFRATISVPVIGRNLRARFSNAPSTGRDANESVHVCNPITEVANDSLQDVEVASDQGDKLSHAVEDTTKSNEATNEISVEESSNFTKAPDQNVGTVDGNVDGGSHLLLRERNELASAEHMVHGSWNRKDNSVGNVVQSAMNRKAILPSTDKHSKGASSSNKMEFDPLRQHRHFCPWVTSTETVSPGWKQTLLALKKEKILALTEPDDSPMSPSLIKVDDPIMSIRRLFKSSATKVVKAPRQPS